MEGKIIVIVLAIVAFQKVNYVVGIAGGKEVVPHSRPYQVGMYVPVYGGGKIFCAGSLITRQTILTAANCFEKVNGPVEVILGAHDVRTVEPTQVRVNTTDIIIHEEWDQTPLFDIAVVRLPKRVKLNKNIRTIALPKKTDTDYIGQNVSVSGWGWVANALQEIAPALQEVELPIIDNFACEIPYLGYVDETTLCTSGENYRATCIGDKGDPAVINNVLVGIVSMKNHFLCEEGWPSAQVRVASYLKWIKQNTI